MTLALKNGDECPKCSGFIWRPGPRGGVSQNMECVGCKSRFNVIRLEGSFQTLTVAEHLPSEAEGGGKWRTDMFRQVLE